MIGSLLGEGSLSPSCLHDDGLQRGGDSKYTRWFFEVLEQNIRISLTHHFKMVLCMFYYVHKGSTGVQKYNL